MAHCLLARDGWAVNHKRVQRLWREEGLRRPAKATKTCRMPGTTVRLRAEFPNHLWAIDFQFDETDDGRRVKLTNIVDEHTREALEMRVGRTCTADHLVASLDRLVAARGAPRFLAYGQRSRTRCLGRQGVVPAVGDRDGLHRAGLAMGEPLRRVLQRPRP